MSGTTVRALRLVLRGVLVLLGSAVVVAAAFVLWLKLRAQPEPIQERWYSGVTYERIVMQKPRPVVAHLVKIDLSAPGIDVVVTAGQASTEGDVRAQTTSAFARQHGVQLAINGSYFYPFRSVHPWDYEPHVGDPVRVVGWMAARGAVYGRPGQGLATLYISRSREVSFDAPVGPLWNAISGMGYVVQAGAVADFTVDEFTKVPYPRSLLAVDETGRSLLSLVVDGKQPGYSEGLTLWEAAELLRAHGGWTGIQLDGGGSATLVRQRRADAIEQVNTPANFRVPGWERVVATHIGIFARE